MNTEWNGKGYHCRGGAYGGCGQTFGRLGSFDLHRRGDRCADPAKIGMHLDDEGMWRQPEQDFSARRTVSSKA